jgi:hypothetical protein
MDTLKPFKDPKYLPLEEALKQVQAYVPPVIEHDAARLSNAGFDIKEFDDFYRIYGATYHGKKDTVIDLKHELLDGGNKRNFKEWVSIETDPGWMVPSVEMYTAIIIALYDNNQHPDVELRKKVKDMRSHIKSQFNNSPMMTRNEIMYRSDGSAIIDNYLDGIAKTVSFCFDSVLMADDNEWAENLFGYPDAGKIRDSYSWLARTFVEAPMPQPHVRCTMKVSEGGAIINGVGMGFERKDSFLFMIRADIDMYVLQLPAQGVRLIQRSDIEKVNRK